MSDHRRDVWDALTLALWIPFFLIGLVPELAFYVFREFARVPPYTALVNSSAVITLTFAAYFAFFAYRRCQEVGLSRYIAQGKALEVGLLALVAFLDMPAKGFTFEARTLLAVLLEFGQIPDRYLQMIVLFVGASKMIAWLFLLSLVVRYHAFGNRRTFAQVPSLFPSMHAAANENMDAAETESESHQTTGETAAERSVVSK